MKVISGSINLMKIPTERIKTKDKDGNLFSNGAKYLDLQVLVMDKPDQYGNDVQIIVGQTKEEREDKSAKTYLGNAKVVWSNDSQKQEPKEEVFQVKDNTDGMPF